MPMMWAVVGFVGAALPLLRRPAWSAPTKNMHLVMCAVAACMVVPAAPWWLLIAGPLLLAGAAGRLFRTAHGSPECVPCLLDAVAMSVMVLLLVVIGINGTAGSVHSMADHSASTLSVLGIQIGLGWAVAAYWTRTHPLRGAMAVQPGQPSRLIRTPVAVALAGSVLMAGSMSAMLVG